jgi:hypothetical protein
MQSGTFNRPLFHVSDDVVVIFTDERARIIIFTHDTTHIFQMLDVMVLGALKRHAISVGTFDEDQPAAALLLKVYADFKQTNVEINR